MQGENSYKKTLGYKNIDVLCYYYKKAKSKDQKLL